MAGKGLPFARLMELAKLLPPIRPFVPPWPAPTSQATIATFKAPPPT
jgi:hypothetical protein